MIFAPAIFSFSRPGVTAVLMALFFVHCCSWVWASSVSILFKKASAAFSSPWPMRKQPQLVAAVVAEDGHALLGVLQETRIIAQGIHLGGQ